MSEIMDCLSVVQVLQFQILSLICIKKKMQHFSECPQMKVLLVGWAGRGLHY
jgi:hypothetical protein